jgi:hypothetical protein
MVLIKDHHPGYVSWEEYERNQAMIAANTPYAVRRRAEGRPGRPSFAFRAPALPTLWTNVVRGLFGTAGRSHSL